MEGREEYQKLSDAQTALAKAIDAYKDSLQAVLASIRNWHGDDPISKLYATVFPDDAIIEPATDRNGLLKDLTRRNTHEVPPGFEDDGRLGDLIIWHSILHAAELQKRNLIFVSNETKIDWVHHIGDKGSREGLFTRYELIDEYYRISQGKHFAIVEFSRFLKLAGAKPTTVDEAKNVASLSSMVTLPPSLVALSEYLKAVSLIIMEFVECHSAVRLDPPSYIENDELSRMVADFGNRWRILNEEYPGIVRRLRLLHAFNIADITLQEIEKLNKKNLPLGPWKGCIARKHD